MDVSSSESIYGVPKVQHESGWPIRTIQDHLKNSGAHEVMIAEIVDAEGRWNVRPSHTDLYSAANVEEVVSIVGQELCTLYHSGKLSIVQAYWGLFNSHTWEDHVEPVSRNAARLGFEADLDHEQIMTICTAASGHDLGILQRRKIHNLISPRIFSRKFPRLLEDADRWHEIEQAIILHDEGAYRSMGLSGKKLDERLEIMRRSGASKMSAPIVVADKFDIDPRRVWYTACTRGGMDNHFHSVINTAVSTIQYGFDPKSGKFEIKLAFNPTIQPTEREKYQGLTTTQGTNGYQY